MSDPTPNDPRPLDVEPAAPSAPAAGAAKAGVDLVALRARVLATLQQRHRLHGQMAAVVFTAGLATLLIIGFVLSTVLSFLGYMLFEHGLGFWSWFGLYILLLIPILIWQERRVRNGFFTFASADVDLRRDPDSAGDFLLHRAPAQLVAFGQALLWPPRALIAGARGLAGKRQEGLEQLLAEAADTLTLLLSIDGGVKIRDLVDPADDAMQLMPILKWLDVHDYIGISSRGDRVWVSSPAKKLFFAT